MLIVFSFFIAIGIFSQDIHFSQFGSSVLNVNPALTGVFKGDKRFTGNLRSQWNTAPVSYLTFSGAYDIVITDKTGKRTPWSGGVIFNYDRAGDSKLNLSGLSFSGSYFFKINKNSQLSIGLTGGVAQRAYNTSGIFFADQYAGKDELDMTQEFMDNTKKFYTDFAGGFNLNIKSPKNRSSVNVGTGIFHFNTPQNSFYNESKRFLKKRIALHGMGTLMVADKFDILFDIIKQYQGAHTETLLGIGGLFHISQKRTKELALMTGISIRNKDAIIPVVGINYNGWKVGLSYDINVSEFEEASSKRGGPELSVIYIFTKVLPAEYCPLCPVYL